MKELGDFTDIDDRQLVVDAVTLAEHENTVTAQKLAHLAEIDRRGLALTLNASSITRWWARGTRVTDGNAARQLDHDHWLGAWPIVHRALFDADIHHAHTVAIHNGLDAVMAADALSQERQTEVVADLLHVARTGTTHTIGRRASTLALAAARDAHARAEKARAAAEEARAAAEQARRTAEQQARRTAGSDDESDPEPDPTPPPPAPDPLPLPTPPVPPSENAALNRLSIHPLPNGRHRLDGDLDTLTTDTLRAALDPHCAPVPGPHGERDPRPPAQRTADALATLLDRHVRGGHKPTFAGTIDLAALTRRNPADTGRDSSDTAGTDTGPTDTGPNDTGPNDTGPNDTGPNDTGPAHTAPGHDHSEGDRSEDDRLLSSHSATPPGRVPPAFTTPPTDTDTDTGTGDWPFQLAWTGPVSHALALLVTCDAHIDPIVVDGAGVPLAMGRTVRTVTADQRTAVTVRDRCCILCGRPPQWCQVHHLIHWAHGGPTDLDNLALLCGECHRHVHQHGWEIVLGDDRHPRIIPPASTDPTRPATETYHRQRRRDAA
ncbi:hypothetical protein GCM10007304_00610 [Rhodococcoides trifolii]|uniref:HNH nuclease domain-containing protein n=1 Tax=Rhodococcoides trifolii TaxID=908250 RepID=A0A917CK87_9NOCA|nr:HNH endonuclease signature motif containing protein [Rhodococcus trifolii]GGF90585.1 hypothetical protein GCM10007304_00610 [Rhodococcus trifolii]